MHLVLSHFHYGVAYGQYSGDNETVFNLSGDGEMLIPIC